MLDCLVENAIRLPAKLAIGQIYKTHKVTSQNFPSNWMFGQKTNSVKKLSNHQIDQVVDKNNSEVKAEFFSQQIRLPRDALEL